MVVFLFLRCSSFFFFSVIKATLIWDLMTHCLKWSRFIFCRVMILSVIRFMVDSDVVGCCWIELPKGKYRVRDERNVGETDSRYPGKVGPTRWTVTLSRRSR